MKKLIHPPIILLALVCLLHSVSIFGQASAPAFDLTTILSGTKHALLEFKVHNKGLIVDAQNTMINDFSNHLKRIGFERVAYTPAEKTNLTFSVPTLCDIIKIRVDVTYTPETNEYTKHRISFHTCLSDKEKDGVFKFNQTPILADVNLNRKLMTVWQEMYNQPLNYTVSNRLVLPKTESITNENMVRKTLRESNDLDFIEGIYEKESTHNVSDKKHTVAVLRGGDEGYNIFYLGGATNYLDWNIGELIGSLPINGSNSQFNDVRWRVNDRTFRKNGIITFKDNRSFALNFPGHEYTYDYKNTAPQLVNLGDSRKLEMSNISRNMLSNPTDIYKLPTAERENYDLKSTGTGITITKEGVIITNYHVIESYDYIELMIPFYGQAYRAKVVYMDEDRDLAILKINDQDFTPFTSIPYSIKDPKVEAEVGENAFTIGYPMINTMGGTPKLTDGLISASCGYQGDLKCYQVSVPVNSGNSGGPLFNDRGELIGIIKAKHSKATNATYALKNSNILDLMDNGSLPINLPQQNTLSELPMTEQFKKITPFVFIVKVYTKK